MRQIMPPGKFVRPTSSGERQSVGLPRVALSSWAWSWRGGRDGDNQDAFLNWPERRCWAVADGVGGSEHGGEASRALVRSLAGLPEAESLEAHVRHARAAIQRVNAALLERTLISGSAASTIVVLLMHEGRAACLWSGDSRCYLLRGETLYQCTRDHTLRQEKIDSGELTVPEAHRMIKGNIITQAIGGRPDPRVDGVRFTLHAGDRLLLCSDGLSNALDGDTLTRLLGRGNARESAEALRAALEEGNASDNATAITVFLTPGA